MAQAAWKADGDKRGRGWQAAGRGQGLNKWDTGVRPTPSTASYPSQPVAQGMAAARWQRWSAVWPVPARPGGLGPDEAIGLFLIKHPHPCTGRALGPVNPHFAHFAVNISVYGAFCSKLVYPLRVVTTKGKTTYTDPGENRTTRTPHVWLQRGISDPEQCRTFWINRVGLRASLSSTLPHGYQINKKY